MGTMRLALVWEAKISSSPVRKKELPNAWRHGESRVTYPEAAHDAFAGNADSHVDDSALAAACKNGDLRAFERLYLLYGSRMKSMARNLLGSAADAEDAVQDTFLKIQRGVASFRGQSSFATWSFRILVNTCHDARRSRLRKKEVGNDEPCDGPAYPELRAPSAHPALRLALERAVAQLTGHQQSVFLLYEVEGFRHAEIAAILDISETASKNTLFQAKKNLRQALQAPRSSSAEAR